MAAKMRTKRGIGGKPLAGDAYRKAVAEIVPEGSHPNRGTMRACILRSTTLAHSLWNFVWHHIDYSVKVGGERSGLSL